MALGRWRVVHRSGCLVAGLAVAVEAIQHEAVLVELARWLLRIAAAADLCSRRGTQTLQRQRDDKAAPRKEHQLCSPILHLQEPVINDSISGLKLASVVSHVRVKRIADHSACVLDKHYLNPTTKH